MEPPTRVHVVQKVRVVGDSQGGVNNFSAHELGIRLLVLGRDVVIDLSNIHLVVLVVVQVVELRGRVKIVITKHCKLESKEIEGEGFSQEHIIISPSPHPRLVLHASQFDGFILLLLPPLCTWVVEGDGHP